MGVLILDTSAGDEGTEKESVFARDHGPSHVGIFSVEIAAGDTVVIYGRVAGGNAEQPLATVEAEDEPPFELVLPQFFRAARTVDGGVGDATVYVEERLA